MGSCARLWWSVCVANVSRAVLVFNMKRSCRSSPRMLLLFIAVVRWSSAVVMATTGFGSIDWDTEDTGEVFVVHPCCVSFYA